MPHHHHHHYQSRPWIVPDNDRFVTYQNYPVYAIDDSYVPPPTETSKDNTQNSSPLVTAAATAAATLKASKERKLRVPRRGKCNFPCHRGRLRDHLQLKDASGVRAYWDARKVSTVYGICCTCYPRLMQTPSYQCQCPVKHDISIIAWLIGCIRHAHTVDRFEQFEVVGSMVSEGFRTCSYLELTDILERFRMRRVILRRNMIKITPIKQS